MTTINEAYTVQSFEGFVGSSLPRLLRFAGWVAGPTGDPEDLVQDALERTGMRWRQVAAGDPESYVRRAIVNGHLSRRRKRSREVLVDAVPEGVEPGVSSTDVQYGALWQAVGALPRGQRAVVALRYFEDLNVSEAARVLGVSQGTVKTQTHRAMDTLRSSLRSDGHGYGDDELGRFIALGAASVPAVPVPPGAARQIADSVQARRKRRTATWAAGVGAGLAVVVALAIWSPWSAADQLQPVVPAPSIDSTQSPVAPTTSVPTPTTQPSTSQPSTALNLAAYTFGFEDSADEDALRSLIRTTDITTPWSLDPCGQLSRPTDSLRTAYVQSSIFLADSGVGAAMAEYPDEPTAAAVVADLRQAVATCPGPATPAPGTSQARWVAQPVSGLGDEAVAVLSTEGRADPDPECPACPGTWPGVDYVAVRLAATVLVVSADAFYIGYGTDEERLAAVIASARREVERLAAAAGE